MTPLRKLLATLALAILAAPAAADVTVVGDADQPVVRYVRSQALLLGVSDYTAGWNDLPSIPEELEQVKAALEAQDFEVETILDPDEDGLRAAVESFIDSHGFGPENRLLIFFAGHGHTRTVGGQRRGYLVPADAPLPTSGKVQAFLRKAVPMTQVVTWARQLEARHALFVFDSCFSGTVFDTRSEIPEPAHITSLTGKPVRQFLTAGRAGEPVPAKSVFTPAFVRALAGAGDLTRDGYVTGTELGVYLHQEVAGTGQTPQYGRLPDPGFREGDFVFRLPFEAPPAEVPFDLGDFEERLGLEAGWASYQERMATAYEQVVALEELDGSAATKAAAWQRFLDSFEAENPFSSEDGELRERARERLGYWRSRPAAVARSPPDQTPRPARREAGDLWTDPAIGMRFRWVPGGTFQMGSPTGEKGRLETETQHEVTLSRGFWMGETEVTQEQWRQVMGNTPSYFENCGDECPVEQVSWYDAVAFANALSERAGLQRCYEVAVAKGKMAGDEYDNVSFKGLDCTGYRLPTEAEWEFAARAGTTSPFSSGSNLSSDEANYDGKRSYIGDSASRSRVTTVPAGSLPPNLWKLHEIHGNVAEWVWDRFQTYRRRSDSDPTGPTTGAYRVVRGGSWQSPAHECRSASRRGGAPTYRNARVGFRLVMMP